MTVLTGISSSWTGPQPCGGLGRELPSCQGTAESQRPDSCRVLETHILRSLRLAGL